MKIMVGADPEIFMFQDGRPVSAHGAVAGTKHDPLKVKDGAVQVDGMALEFNIDPADSAEKFVGNIESVLATLRNMVPGFDLIPQPVAEFGEEYIKQQPKEALVLGCDPDFNAWNRGKVNPRPNGNNPFRTAAGHVHIGWTNDVDPHNPQHKNAGIMLVKQLDFYLGLPSLLYDHDSKRRTMYGALGAFRPKPYGVEYRVLSNVWLSSKELMSWVYNNTVLAVNRLAQQDRAYEKIRAPKSTLDKLFKVKTPDLDMVNNLLNDLNIPAPPMGV